MEEVIKKWELILQQDSCRDITYGRKVLEEMLTDVKIAVKNCSIPPVIKSVCQCCGKRTIDYFNTKCKSCGTEHTYKQTVL